MCRRSPRSLVPPSLSCTAPSTATPSRSPPATYWWSGRPTRGRGSPRTCRHPIASICRGGQGSRACRRILGQSLHFWGDHLGLIGAPLDSLRGRTQRGDVLVGQSLRQLARRHGVELVGRAVDAEGTT